MNAPKLRTLLQSFDSARGVVLEMMVLESDNAALRLEVDRLRDLIQPYPGGQAAVPASPEPAPFPVAAGAEPASGGSGAEPPERRNTRPKFCTSCFRWQRSCWPVMDLAPRCDNFDRLDLDT